LKPFSNLLWVSQITGNYLSDPLEGTEKRSFSIDSLSQEDQAGVRARMLFQAIHYPFLILRGKPICISDYDHSTGRKKRKGFHSG
jgi:hypothetical protein